LKSNLISKSETDDLLKQVSAQWKIEIPKAKNLKIHYIMDNVQIFTANDIMILKIEETYLPFLSQTSLLEKFPHVLVDMGAVKFMCNGANVMRPGIFCSYWVISLVPSLNSLTDSSVLSTVFLSIFTKSFISATVFFS